MNDIDINEILMNVFKEKHALMDIDPDENFFDVGVSSLTIVDLQIKAEEVLNLTASTSELIRNSSKNGWIEIYSQKLREARATV